jgi:hypothetical protein
VANCPFWLEIRRSAFGSPTLPDFQETYALQQQVDRIRYLPQILNLYRTQGYSQNSEAYAGILRRLYGAIGETTTCRAIIDSSKDISTLFLLAKMPEFRVRVLHLIRDSRAVAFSWMRKKVRSDVKEHVSYMSVYSPYRSAADWNYRNLLTEMAQKYAYEYLRVHYEDLLANPPVIMKKISDFMGLRDVDLSFVGQDRVSFSRDTHTVAGNPMRFQKGSVTLHLDNIWQGEFKPLHKAIVTTLTWPLLWHYGYDLG